MPGRDRSINRILEEGHETNIKQAIFQVVRSRSQFRHSFSTLCICIVFMPLFLLSGVARYLFIPLAEAKLYLPCLRLPQLLSGRSTTLAMYMLKLIEGHGEVA